MNHPVGNGEHLYHLFEWWFGDGLLLLFYRFSHIINDDYWRISKVILWGKSSCSEQETGGFVEFRRRYDAVFQAEKCWFMPTELVFITNLWYRKFPIYFVVSMYLCVNLSIYQSINLSIYQSINLSIYQSINLSIYQSIYLSLSLYIYIMYIVRYCKCM